MLLHFVIFTVSCYLLCCFQVKTSVALQIHGVTGQEECDVVFLSCVSSWSVKLLLSCVSVTGQDECDVVYHLSSGSFVVFCCVTDCITFYLVLCHGFVKLLLSCEPSFIYSLHSLILTKHNNQNNIIFSPSHREQVISSHSHQTKESKTISSSLLLLIKPRLLINYKNNIIFSSFYFS